MGSKFVLNPKLPQNNSFYVPQKKGHTGLKLYKEGFYFLFFIKQSL